MGAYIRRVEGAAGGDVCLFGYHGRARAWKAYSPEGRAGMILSSSICFSRFAMSGGVWQILFLSLQIKNFDFELQG